jgi:hypothetical protein
LDNFITSLFYSVTSLFYSQTNLNYSQTSLYNSNPNLYNSIAGLFYSKINWNGSNDSSKDEGIFLPENENSKVKLNKYINN